MSTHQHPHQPSGVDDSYSFGVTLLEVLEATKVCGDTSVLEALFPWAFETEEGKEILEKGKETPEKRVPEAKPEEGKTEVVLKMTMKEAEVLRCVLGSISGTGIPGKGAINPRRTAGLIFQSLVDQGVTQTYMHRSGGAMPNNWEDFYTHKRSK